MIQDTLLVQMLHPNYNNQLLTAGQLLKDVTNGRRHIINYFDWINFFAKASLKVGQSIAVSQSEAVKGSQADG